MRIAALCGGDPDAVEQVVRGLPGKTGLACLVCFAGDGLAERLQNASALVPHVVTGGESIEPDHLYVLPADREVTLEDGRLVVAAPNGPAGIDRLLRSVAESGHRSVVAVLAGRRSDGALGLKRIKENGGIVLCQSAEGAEAEFLTTAMATGVVDLVLPLEEIAPRLVELAAETRDVPPPAADVQVSQDEVADSVRDILAMLRTRTGHDFSAYKRATLYRRIARRMQVCQMATIGDYQRYLREYPNEQLQLLRDFLISVTNFFRDPETFEALASQVIGRILRGKGPTDQVRVWVAGCATGEEAYSVGILLAEATARVANPPQLQVFATDIDEFALAEARAGVYPVGIELDVSPERLARYFIRENDHYRVTPELREMVLFSVHNLLRDPPFSRLDLITCRNLLIYLNREAQDRVLGTFHFALKADGFLMLGSSEGGEGSPLFGALDAKNRLFVRRLAQSAVSADAFAATSRWSPARPALPVIERTAGSFGELHHRVVEKYAPPSVLVNEELDVVHLSEHAGKFLELQGGEPTRQLLRLVHESLRVELRGAIYAARQSESGSETRVVRFETDGKTRVVEIRVRAVSVPELGRGALLILFDELNDSARPVAVADPKFEPVVRELEEELHRTRDQLRTTVEQYETSLEELKASNEELHAINEELRSTTEELETGKEELQSVNEELTTLNHELNDKVDEVSRANSDLQNLMSSTDIAVLFLDRNLRIKRFTPRTQHLFNIIPGDIGRPFAHLTHRLASDDLVASASQVLVDLRITERTVFSDDGTQYLARFLPYRSLDDRIEGVVLTFVDVSEREHARAAHARSEAELRTAEERLAFALRSAPVAIIVQDAKLETTWAFVNGRELHHGQRTAPDIFVGDHGERFAEAARQVLATNSGQRIELDVAVAGEPRTYDFRLELGRGAEAAVTAVGFDITPSKHAERELLDSDRRKDEFLATLSHELRNPLTPLRVAFEVLKRSDNDQARAATARTIIEVQLDLLIRLVDDLLDLSRITQGKLLLERQPIDIVRVIETALASIRPLIDEAKHELTVTLPSRTAIVMGDFGRLNQVLTNLLANAAKYTPPAGRITLTAEVVGRDVAIRVRDTGVGIAPDLLPYIFEIFVQSRDDLGRSRGGLGIGLNLVRRLVELHGGRVTAESDGVQRGSCFTVELPLHKEAS